MTMQEILTVKQDPESGQGRKRWFRGESFDIFTWQDTGKVGGERFTSLHLCYGRGSDEHILRWDQIAGYFHESVDADEQKPGRAMSAILRANGAFPADLVLQQFLDIAPELPRDVAAFIEDRIRDSATCTQPPLPPV